MQSQSPTTRPYVVTVIPDTPTETTPTTVVDVLIGSVSMAAVLLCVALVLGVVFGGLRVGYQKWFGSKQSRSVPIAVLHAPASTFPNLTPSRPRAPIEMYKDFTTLCR